MPHSSVGADRNCTKSIDNAKMLVRSSNVGAPAVGYRYISLGVIQFSRWKVMFMEAYILVKIATQTEELGFNRSVVEKLSQMEGVEYAQLLFGDYDAIVKLNVPKIHDCENLVIEDISTVKGVQSTVTLLCVDEGILE